MRDKIGTTWRPRRRRDSGTSTGDRPRSRQDRGWDPEPVQAAVARGQALFDEHGIEAELCLVAPDENPEAAIVEALTRKDYACVVIGGGIRKDEPLLELRTAEAEKVVVDMERKVVAATRAELPPVPETTVREPAEARRIGLFSALKFLWSGNMARRTAITWLIWFVITFSYYGFFTWIPTLLVERGITVTKSFEFSIIIYLAQVPGYFSAAWLGEFLDRKNTIALYLAGAAASAYWMSQMTDPVLITTAAAVLSFFLNGTYAGVYSYTPEVFPTWIRASGTGLSSAFGRIGSIIAPTMIGVWAATLGFAGVFGLTTAVLAVGVAATLLFGLSTAGRSLEDLTEPGAARSQEATP